MSDDDDNVIRLFGPTPDPDGTPGVQQRTQFCYRHAPLLDKVSRTIQCDRCKQSLDAFDCLLQVAQDHDHWQRLLAESRTMRRELETLKAEEKRVKARTKSHRNKDAMAAVADERRKHVRRHAEMACRVDDVQRALKRLQQLIGVTLNDARHIMHGIDAPDRGVLGHEQQGVTNESERL